MYIHIKRMLDIVLSILGILALSPLLIVISLLVRCSTMGSVIFRQERMGRDMKPFTLYKFRTMHRSAPANVATEDLQNAAACMTWIGGFLRKYSLDELPQLINILKGDMSLVGPRPVILDEKKLINLRQKLGVYSVRPGLTGWAQINGRDNINYHKKAEYDAEYVRNMSFSFDLKCLFGTVGKVAKHAGVKH